MDNAYIMELGGILNSCGGKGGVWISTEAHGAKGLKIFGKWIYADHSIDEGF